jgi:hypothetical protein
MTHDELVLVAVKWLRNTKNCSVVFAELSTSAAEIPDAIGWNASGRSVLVEVKTSLSDFYADRKKIRSRFPSLAVGNQRWYLTEPGVIPHHLIPSYWGLIEFTGRRCMIRKRATTQKCSQTNELRMLISACRRWTSEEQQYNRVTGRFKHVF